MATNSTAVATYSKDTSLARFNNFLFNEKIQTYLSDVIKDNKDKFISNVIALVSSNVALQECTPDSVMFACMKATALKLNIDQSLGLAYILPYYDNKTRSKKAQFQIGWRGYMQLALQSGQVIKINVDDVREGELVSRDRLTGDCVYDWIQDDKVRSERKIIGYLGYIKLKSGFIKSMYMSMEQLENHGKKYSQTYQKGYGVWADDFCSMAKKTIYRYLLKNFAPLNEDLTNAINSDYAVITEQGYDYIDNQSNVDKNAIVSEFEQALNDMDATNAEPEEDYISKYTKPDNTDIYGNTIEEPSALLD